MFSVLIQIDVFVTSQNSLDLSIECIKRVRKMGFPILVTSHLKIPDEIKLLADFYYEDLNNVLLPPDSSRSSLTFECEKLYTSIVLENSDQHAPACLSSLINGARFGLNNGFDFFVRIEYDVIIKNIYIECLSNLIKISTFGLGMSFISDNWLDGSIIMMNCREYLKIFNIDINSYSDYYDIIDKYDISSVFKRHLQNVQYIVYNKNNYLNNIIKVPTYFLDKLLDHEYIDNKPLKFGMIVPVFIDGEFNKFAVLCHGWSNSSVLVRIYINSKLDNEFNMDSMRGKVTYVINDYEEGSSYGVIYRDPFTDEEIRFDFNSIEQLKNYGKISFK